MSMFPAFSCCCNCRTAVFTCGTVATRLARRLVATNCFVNDDKDVMGCAAAVALVCGVLELRILFNALRLKRAVVFNLRMCDAFRAADCRRSLLCVLCFTSRR